MIENICRRINVGLKLVIINIINISVDRPFNDVKQKYLQSELHKCVKLACIMSIILLSNAIFWCSLP